MLAAFVVLAVLQVADGNEAAAAFSGYVRSARWDFRITRTMLAQAPAWEETELSPPLPARRAIAIAATQLAELLPDAAQWRLTSVSLRQIGGGNRWVYVIEYVGPPPRPEGGITSEKMPIVVLMNGATVVPTRSPWP